MDDKTMDDKTPLPAYSASTAPSSMRLEKSEKSEYSSTDLPPTYEPPKRFTIGESTTLEPLVSIQQIKGHLALLRAFAELKTQIENYDTSKVHKLSDADAKWAWFVGLAVERFDRWCQLLQPDVASQSTQDVMPPIDVLMVWHAYMLNPRWYAEDGLRQASCEILRSLEVHFLGILEDPSLISYPTTARIQLWEARTLGLPFDHIASMHTLNQRSLWCPNCESAITVDLLLDDGKGYLQQGFVTTCSHCGQGDITKAVLAHRKLAADIAVMPINNAQSRLAGSYWPPSSDTSKVDQAKTLVYTNAKPFHTGQPALNEFNAASTELRGYMTKAIMKQHDTMVKLRTQLQVRCSGRIFNRVITAYNDDKVYSIDLVGAVLRQGTFVKKMYDLGWTQPGFFSGYDDELALHHALARYHAFLDLMTTSPVSFFVPTLDIDLVWHTHQLLPAKYEADTALYLKRFIDHDDKVEGLRLSSAFDMTCKAWKGRFNVSYTHCGCAVVGDTIGQRLTRMVGLFGKPEEPPSHLIPANRGDLLAATHPSDHNAVHFQARTESAHKVAVRRYEALAWKKQKEQQKWDKKRAKSLAQHDDERRKPGYIHDTMFLTPVPLFYPIGGLGYGYVGGYAGGCVGGGGGVVGDVSGSCASCGSGGVCGGGGCAGSSAGGSACGGGGGGE